MAWVRRVFRWAALVVCCVLLSCSAVSTRSGFPEEPREKSVVVGELLALFPGLLWHGLGHRYAGDQKKAEEIELMEAYSLLSMGAGAGMVFGGRDNDNLRFLEYSGYTVGGLGGLLFLGSWLYDVIYTPEAVERYNRSLREP